VQLYDKTSQSRAKPSWYQKQMIRVICHKDRLFFCNEEMIGQGLKLAVGKEKELSQAEWKRAMDYFKHNDIGDKFIKLRLEMKYIAFEFRPGTPGENHNELLSGQSPYESYLRTEISPNDKWLKFYVWDDSFRIYTLARNIAERRGFKTGWLPYDRKEELRLSVVGTSQGPAVGPDKFE